MLESWILARYDLNYSIAVEDGHEEEANNVAWEWTEEEFISQFHKTKGQKQAQQQEEINNAFHA